MLSGGLLVIVFFAKLNLSTKSFGFFMKLWLLDTLTFNSLSTESEFFTIIDTSFKKRRLRLSFKDKAEYMVRIILVMAYIRVLYNMSCIFLYKVGA